MRRLPLLQGILPLAPARLPGDLLAGITLAALGIPEVLGYAKIAGMPVVTGLYTLLLPMAVFAVFGSSRHLVVGADSATAAILAAGLVGAAAAGSSHYVGLAGLAALIAGGLLLLARLARLGFLANFLSRTVLIGFLTGVGISVAAGQLSEMLGVRRAAGPARSASWSRPRRAAGTPTSPRWGCPSPSSSSYSGSVGSSGGCPARCSRSSPRSWSAGPAP